MTVQNDFTMYRRLLAGERLAIDANEPWAGFYRLRRRGRDGYIPVAFWRDTGTGEWRCHLDGADVEEKRAIEIWPYAAKNPVSGGDYRVRMNSGRWPGEHEAVIGHNVAPLDDTPEAIGERIEDLAREAERLITSGAAMTQAACDQASDLANTLGELEGKCNKLHGVEKAPHLDAGREVDRKWFPLRDHAAGVKQALKRGVITPFLRRKQDEAIEAQVAAITGGAAPETVPQPKITAGSSKRPTALRTQTSAHVTDWKTLLTALAEHPAMRDCAQGIANASAKAGIALPGTKIVKIKVAA
jgi:hypothetical protein